MTRTKRANQQSSTVVLDNQALLGGVLDTIVQDALATAVERQEDLSGDQASSSDLRHNTRQHFYCIQLIAPYDGRRMPSQAEFQPFPCHDLSPTGFSYWQQAPVAASHLIVALGEVPFLFFVAEIVHQAYEPHGELGSWRIGCRFIRRVERKLPEG
jgi:hypothetical protein